MGPAVLAAGTVIGGKAVKEVVEETVKGVFGVASAAVTAAGEAAKGVGSAIGGALQGALSPAPITIVNNMGMMGEAAKSKVSGGGTLPAIKKAAKPVINSKMPTEKLLTVAVGYLSSIEKTLESQLNFDRLQASQQAVAEKEAAIEGSDKTRTFRNLGEKLGAIRDQTVDRSKSIASLLVKGAGVATIGLMGLGELDTTQLDRLKQNISAFAEKFWWLDELGVALTGYYIGSKAGGGGVKGVRAGMVGAIGAMAADYLLGDTRFGEYLASQLGIGKPDARAKTVSNANPEASQNSPMSNAISSASKFFGYQFVKSAVNWTIDKTKSGWAKLKTTAAWLWDTKLVKFVRTAATNPKLWARFLTWLETRGGKLGASVAARIASIIATQALTTTAEAGLAATGIGAPVAVVVAIVDKIIAAGLFAWMLYDLYQLWSDFEDWNAANPERVQAEPVTPAAASSGQADAAPASASTSTTPSDALPPAATGSIDAILDKNPENLSDAELRQLVEAQGRIEDPSGKTNNPGGILYGTGPLQEHQLGSVGANANSSVRIAVYDTPENGIRAAMENWRNSRYYRGKTVREGLGTWSGGNGAHYAKMLGSVRPGYEGTSNPQVGSGNSSGLLSGAWDLGAGTIEAIGSILRTAIDSKNMTSVALGSQMSGTTTASSSDMPQPSGGSSGSAASQITPEMNSTTKALTDISTQLQNSVDLGLAEQAQTNIAQESTSQMSIRNANASNDGKLECLDPNFPGTGGVEAYLQYYRMAA